jgi:prepilin-type N-terminal cleavage/methylation domain-containing protein
VRTSRRDRGFTLVEILIAIVLVGILSAVVVVGVGSLTSKGSGAACSSSLDAARTASSARLVTVGSYPTSLAQLVTEGGISAPSGTSLVAGGTTIAGSSWRLALVAGVTNAPPTLVCLNDATDLGGFEEGAQAAYANWVNEAAGAVEGPWTITSALTRDHAATHGGAGTVGHHVDLDATGAITRTVSGLTPGTTYALTFITAKHKVNTGTASARVDIGGASLSWSPTNSSAGQFQVMTLTFTPSTSTVTLTFTGTGSANPCCGVLVDDPVIGLRTG